MVRDNMYVLKNRFSHRGEEIQEYIQSVYVNSYNYYKDNYYSRSISSIMLDQDLKCILNGLEYLEDYLYYYDMFYSDYFDGIFNELQGKLKIITVLPFNRRGIYGEFREKEKLIYLNPNLGASSTLSSEDRTRLYMCHELGHIINNGWMNVALQISGNFPDLRKGLNDLNKLDSMLESNRIDYSKKEEFKKEIQALRKKILETMQLRYDGFSLIDEVTTQNRAEAITYYFAGKIRPSIRGYKGRLFNGEVYYTNFDYYGELEDLAITFGKTLRGIGNVSDEMEVMKLLSIRTLDGRFVDKLFYEYENDGHLEDLYLILENMGKIKNASYALFGYADPKYIGDSKRAKDEISNLAIPLRDYRKPYNY